MPASNVSFMSPDADKQMEIQRRQALAQALQQQSMEPIQNPNAGGWAVPIHPLQGLAKLAQAGVGNMQQNRAQELARALGQGQQERRGADMSLLVNALQGRKAQPGGLSEDAAGNVTPTDPIAAQSPVQSLWQAIPMLQDPQMQQMGFGQLMSQMQRDNAPPEMKDLGSRIGLIKNGQIVGYLPKDPTPDAVLSQTGQDRRHAMPSGSAQLSAQTQTNLHQVPSGSSQLSATVTREQGAANRGITTRGQNLTNDRAAEANQVAAGRRLEDKVTAIRKEFDDAPEVKNYRTVLPIIESAKNAPNTAAGDLDLIYAVGKILDPTSVVREGEMALVIKSGSPIERMKGTVQFIMQGKGRLTEAQRAQLTGMLEGRVGELKKGYESAKALYLRTAQAQNLPLDQIFREGVENYGGGNVIDFNQLPSRLNDGRR